MLRLNHIDVNYLDFLYRLNDFFALIPESDRKLTALDAVILYSLVRSHNPSFILEIGRSAGTCTLVICGAISDSGHGHLYSVDLCDNFNNEVRTVTSGVMTELLLDSKDLLQQKEIIDKKFQLFFIDGNHSVAGQIADIETCYHLSDNRAFFILHDADMPETTSAAKQSCSNHRDLVDLGLFGDQLRVLLKQKN